MRVALQIAWKSAQLAASDVSPSRKIQPGHILRLQGEKAFPNFRLEPSYADLYEGCVWSNLASFAGLDPSGQDVPKSRHENGSILMRFWGTGSGTVQAVWGIRWQLFREVGSCSRACWMLFPSVAARDRGCARSCVIRGGPGRYLSGTCRAAANMHPACKLSSLPGRKLSNSPTVDVDFFLRVMPKSSRAGPCACKTP